MVKRRDPQKNVTMNSKIELTNEQVEAFAAAADGGVVDKVKKEKGFKSITIAFMQKEYEQLHDAAIKSGRSKLSFIRRAIQEKADALLIRNEKDV